MLCVIFISNPRLGILERAQVRDLRKLYDRKIFKLFAICLLYETIEIFYWRLLAVDDSNQLNSILFANHITFYNEYNEMRP